MMDSLRFDEQGLIPAIVQDYKSGQVLMLAYMNRESLAKTMAEGQTWFYSRSRQQLWHKGEESGHTQEVKNVLYDCDADALLIKVEQTGVACHTGHYSCFYRNSHSQEVEPAQFSGDTLYGGKESPAILTELAQVIKQRQHELPEGSYTTYLFKSGVDKIAKKIGEESSEVIIAAKNASKGELVYESADLLYHLLVLLAERQVEFSDVLAELSSRR